MRSCHAGLSSWCGSGSHLSLRCRYFRRGRTVLDYAVMDSEARHLLEQRIAEMERKAARLQVGRWQGAEQGVGGQPEPCSANLLLWGFGPA